MRGYACVSLCAVLKDGQLRGAARLCAVLGGDSSLCPALCDAACICAPTGDAEQLCAVLSDASRSSAMLCDTLLMCSSILGDAAPELGMIDDAAACAWDS